MRSPFRALIALVAVGSLVWLALPAQAERTQSDLVIVRPDDVIGEDLYAAGNAIRIEGRIEGDLYAVAFNDVTITGVVTGDVVAVAGRVEVSGQVGGSLRTLAPEVVVDGSVADDVLAAAWRTRVGRGGDVGRDLLNWSVRAAMEGAVGRNLEGQMRSMDLVGEIGGAVQVVVDRLVVAGTARVGGDLVYESGREAEIGSAEIEGNVIRRTALPPNVRLRGLRLLTYVLAFFSVTALGLLVSWAWPARVEEAVGAGRELVASWVTGLAVMVAPLLAGGVVALLVGLSPPEAGVPLALVLAPVVLGLVGVTFILGLLGIIPVSGLVGRRLLKKRSVAAAFLVGWVILAILLALPIVGWLVWVAAVPLGIGAWLRHRKLPEPALS